MLEIVNCLRYIWYTRRFGSWLYSRFQAIVCHDTNIYFCFIIIIKNLIELVTTVGIQPGTFRMQGLYANHLSTGVPQTMDSVQQNVPIRNGAFSSCVLHIVQG
jgi:hypothetical protein